MEQRVSDVVAEPDREKTQFNTGGLNSIRAQKGIYAVKVRQMEQRVNDVIAEPHREKTQFNTGGLNSIRAQNLN